MKNPDAKIKEFKQIRVEISKLLKQLVKSEVAHNTPRSKEHFFLTTMRATEKLQEARMWLGMSLQALGDSTPYVHSDDATNAIVLPEADTE